MTGTARIGCSGWISRHWRELFYPARLPQRLWFDALTVRAMVAQAMR